MKQNAYLVRYYPLRLNIYTESYGNMASAKIHKFMAYARPNSLAGNGTSILQQMSNNYSRHNM